MRLYHKQLNVVNEGCFALFVEVSGVFLNRDRIGRAGGDAAHAADAVLHVHYLNPVTRVLVDPPGADAHARLTVGALPVVDGNLMQPGRLPSEKETQRYKNKTCNNEPKKLFFISIVVCKKSH